MPGNARTQLGGDGEGRAAARLLLARLAIPHHGRVGCGAYDAPDPAHRWGSRLSRSGSMKARMSCVQPRTSCRGGGPRRTGEPPRRIKNWEDWGRVGTTKAE